MHLENAEISELLMKNDSAILMIVYALFRIFEYINLWQFLMIISVEIDVYNKLRFTATTWCTKK